MLLSTSTKTSLPQMRSSISSRVRSWPWRSTSRKSRSSGCAPDERHVRRGGAGRPRDPARNPRIDRFRRSWRMQAPATGQYGIVSRLYLDRSRGDRRQFFLQLSLQEDFRKPSGPVHCASEPRSGRRRRSGTPDEIFDTGGKNEDLDFADSFSSDVRCAFVQ
jgi:hypothetical protein